MTKLKRTIALISAAAMCCSLAACGDAQNGEDSESAAETSAVSVSDAASNDDGIKAVFGEIRTEYNTNLDLSDYPLTKSDVPADFSLTVEAESGKLEGNAKANDFPDASGGAYVNGVNVEGDALTMTADIEYSGFYDMNFLTMGSEGRVNNVLVDGMKVGDITTNSPAEFGDTLLSYIYLDKGTHEITITPSWGYVDIDCLILTAAATPITEDTYKVEPTLVNPNADENTKRLYKFLCDIYGKYSLAGQYADEGRASSEYEKITAKTGKTFAVLGLDMGNYSLGSKAHGAYV